MMKGEAPKLPQIEIPTCVRWAEHDPVLPYAWTDRLSKSFAHLDLAQFPDVGIFFTGKIRTGRQKRSLVFSDESAGVKSAGAVAFTEARAIRGKMARACGADDIQDRLNSSVVQKTTFPDDR
jgi:hypothetical protein